MTYFIVISIILCVGGGIGLGFWVAAERKARYTAELRVVTLTDELVKLNAFCEELQRVITERDNEIGRLNQVIADKNAYLSKMLSSLEGNVSKEALDALLEEMDKEVVVG